ncbi:hypothetical protein [Sinorhizobium medicae]|uniref:hypothetical protein n=1 Tax=Sinorhizobium medicae TaxID=110321 RepID=UPI0011A65652|nr:hypothetical protein [Sinorhizobium medicae]
MPTLASAQSFDWAAQLGKPLSSLSASLGQSARCSTGSVAVPVRWVNKDTVLTDDLLDPVYSPGAGIVRIGGEPDLNNDYNDERTLSPEKLSSLHCSIGREASVQAYAFEDRIVRIKLTYDRCESRQMRKSTFLSTPDNPLVYEACDGVDLAEKDFDTALFESIKARNAYGYNGAGSPGMLDFKWSGHMSGEYAPSERAVMWSVGCSSRKEVDHLIPPHHMTYRCLIDVENSDPARWSATAIYELLRPGTFFDDVDKRLTAMRLFVDMPAERSAARAIRPELQTMVDGIKATIAARVSDKKAKDSAVSNILGAGN